jgi:hypothetical protein
MIYIPLLQYLNYQLCLAFCSPETVCVTQRISLEAFARVSEMYLSNRVGHWWHAFEGCVLALTAFCYSLCFPVAMK